MRKTKNMRTKRSKILFFWFFSTYILAALKRMYSNRKALDKRYKLVKKLYHFRLKDITYIILLFFFRKVQ